MNGYNCFPPPFPAGHSRSFSPCCHRSVMLPKKVALYPPEDDLVGLSTVYDLLDEQHRYYRELIHQQERNYRAFLQVMMDASWSRTDSLVREMQDLRSCLQRTRAELAEVKKQASQNGKRAECLAGDLVTVREALDGLSLKVGAGGRGVSAKQHRGAAGLKLDGGRAGSRGREAKRTEPKAAKLVADLTDIRFDLIKVGRTPQRAARDLACHLGVWGRSANSRRRSASFGFGSLVSRVPIRQRSVILPVLDPPFLTLPFPSVFLRLTNYQRSRSQVRRC